MGLSISKAYVELLGGKIWVTSRLDKGSVFSFTIPFKTVNPEELIQIQSIKQKTKEPENPITILVAEDEDFNFLFFERLFAEKNITILHAKDGRESVDICRSKIPIDLILMDLKMPIMNGFDATRLIREFMPDIPIIAQTAYTTKKDIENALKCGCNDYISKPFKKEVLLSKIIENLKKA